MNSPLPQAGEVAAHSAAGEDACAVARPSPVLRACLSRAAGEAFVIGVGNPDRGDDAVGRHVARLIGGLDHNGEATTLLTTLQGADRVWLIDAAQSGAPPGTIHRIDCATDTVPARPPTSSHGFGLAAAIELARALGTLPRHCIIYAIEAADFTPGAALSPAVARAAHEVAERIRAELATPRPPSSHYPPRPAPATDRR